ncbi:MAG TPA: C25 family cysteine peptidase [Ideonella sp.]|uniref:C25 family cysteine peptidase n=1 Tax=Ideonella sp. TaxID=1929293 RepID=UPI002CA2EEF7|nr:C25 family cysteine peptidase [Ideonella sp.]HSI50869.1 C25 family cysteine peptidase [Ideonella sp.]
MAEDKLILTHRTALQRKYGEKGLAKVDSALKRLVKADARRGFDSRVIHLDDAATMKTWGGAVSAEPTPKEIKRAIDRLYAALSPHYLLLLGGPDVLPLVPLRNPAFSTANGDPDTLVPSDLPYACDAAYSTDPGRFQGPTRVVGRLPDVPGAREPSALTLLIDASARSVSRPRSDYARAFGISAQAWEASSKLSMENLFGNASALHLVPPQALPWKPVDLAARLHFINCHGAKDMPEFYGQPPGVSEFPVAHRARRLKGRISAGTVVAAECCYGAQLYDPALAVPSGGSVDEPGIALAYLLDGASAVFGSTTIAYGPSEGNGMADLICQYFLQQVMAGSSTGRAMLEARQRFAGARTHLDPCDLKTLAQFCLLGDPSLHPVAFEGHALNRTKAFKKAFAGTQDRTVRGLRREKLARDGQLLGKALPKLVNSETAPGEAATTTLRAMLRESGLDPSLSPVSYEVRGGLQTSASRRLVHLVNGRRALNSTEHPMNSPAAGLVALVLTEQDGELLHVRRLHGR